MRVTAVIVFMVSTAIAQDLSFYQPYNNIGHSLTSGWTDDLDGDFLARFFGGFGNSLTGNDRSDVDIDVGNGNEFDDIFDNNFGVRYNDGLDVMSDNDFNGGYNGFNFGSDNDFDDGHSIDWMG